MTRGGAIVQLAVLPARLLSMLASLPLMAAPFILAWTALIRWRNGAWPPASVADVLAWAHWWAPPGASHVPIWLALGVIGYLGLLLSNVVARASLRLVDRAI